jgi:diguanylate cyclase (GGDEF)-like protein
MQTGAPPHSEKASQAGEARLDAQQAPARTEADTSVQGPIGEVPSDGNGKDPDPRFEATRKATIMIVDDEAIIVEILKSALEDVGYRSFIETTESRRALQLLVDNKPDVVLLDISMPEVTGLDILNSMRGDEALKHIPTIVLTGATDSATKLLALGLGAADVLAKPVDPSELALRVRNTLTARAYQDRLLHFDALTGLPNRRSFMERFANALMSAHEASTECALLLIGLDNFHQINDSLGAKIGDALLKAVAAALEEHTRESDLPGLSGMDEESIALSRVDGVEFALMIPNLPHVEVAGLLSQRILSLLEKPFRLSSRDVRVTASIGITVYPGDGETTDELLASAGAAMAAARERGGNSCQHHATEHNVKSRARQKLAAELKLAPARRELSLGIQPRLEVQSGRVSGVEGAVRWKHPKWGTVPPKMFLPIAEETGLIVPAGGQALYLACALNKRWQSSGIEPIRVSMNISARQFRNVEKLVHTVLRALRETGLDGKFLTLEFPESVLMENPESNLNALQDLKNLGIRLCLDHFGSGLSSMSYLRRFPLDEIKIDGSLLKDVPGDTDAAAVVIAAIKLAQGMGLNIVAEGVKSEDQLAFLKDWGCDEYQGQLSIARTTEWRKSTLKVASAVDSRGASA